MSARMIDLVTSFRYRHGLGDYSPYFDALERGEALGRQCDGCGRTWFPPRLTCACGACAGAWRLLPGQGQVTAVSEGPIALPLTDRKAQGAFALIAMDGACNAALGRLAPGTPAVVGTRVRLSVDPGLRAHPAQAAIYEAVET